MNNKDELERARKLIVRARPGYYPGLDTLAQQRYWDEATRTTVLRRLEQPGPLNYFDQPTAAFWTVVFEHLVPQSDRAPERRIPIIPVVDARLARDLGIGYRFAEMPPDREAYTLGREAIDDEARVTSGAPFTELPAEPRDVVLKNLHDGKPQAGADIWKRMSVHRFWQLIMADATEAYYAHPWAWDEIGFGGPSYPRGYTRLEHGEPEPWEVYEVRYAWSAPSNSVSDETDNVQQFHIESEQHRSHSKSSRDK
jgi:hypothetical protein